MTQSLSSQILAGSESPNSAQNFPKIEYNQPLSSPYEHPVITICIGEKEYGILGSHIRQYPLLGPSSPQDTYVTLSDIHGDVGHTLVHFLYSGTYETINSPLGENISYIEREYQRSVLIYHASRKYQITDLEILARKYIEHFDEAISTFEILRSTGEIFSKLPKDEVWLPGYVRKTLQRSFVSANSRFNTDDLSGILKDYNSFSRAIMLSVIEILSSHIQCLEKGTRSQPHFTSGFSTHGGTTTENLVVVEEWSVTSEKFPAPGECSSPEDPPAPGDPPAPEEPSAEWHARPDETDSAAAGPADSKGSLAKILLPDVAEYHDWENLSPKNRRKRIMKLKKRNLPIPDENGVISISLT
ncbi:hypothetical protein N7452_004241 [Penicillium brevicompactum]|uniref:BTB domain-containing protein n=1 Tax=Penicillium brevicompactum TaxID=5074 RepID=A0A9W9UKR0_PENBR|nr:hypothetical protein N7452_004241 [Penicillium brevicompactum]